MSILKRSLPQINVSFVFMDAIVPHSITYTEQPSFDYPIDICYFNSDAEPTIQQRLRYDNEYRQTNAREQWLFDRSHISMITEYKDELIYFTYH